MRQAVRIVSRAAAYTAFLSLAACAPVAPGAFAPTPAVRAVPVPIRAPTSSPVPAPSQIVSPELTPQRPTPSSSPVVRVNPDPAHRHGALIEISIEKQRLTAWQDGAIVLRTPVSTGMPGYETPKGHFKVNFKSRNVWSRPYSVWLPWALNITGGYFIHELPHADGSTVPEGAESLGRAVSHGCVRVGIPDAARLYRWARTGTPIWIH